MAQSALICGTKRLFVSTSISVKSKNVRSHQK